VSDDYEIALVQGTVIGSDESSLPILESFPQTHLTSSISPPTTMNSMEVDSKQVLSQPLSLTGILPPLPTHTNFIGDMKLTELKTRLTSLRIPAEFAGGGTLVCGPVEGESAVVAVRKGGTGQVLIEGSVGKTYYRLREEIYRMHARAG
jgi:cleavage and polyadenylation specificity factor subunit 2